MRKILAHHLHTYAVNFVRAHFSGVAQPDALNISRRQCQMALRSTSKKEENKSEASARVLGQSFPTPLVCALARSSRATHSRYQKDQKTCQLSPQAIMRAQVVEWSKNRGSLC